MKMNALTQRLKQARAEKGFTLNELPRSRATGYLLPNILK